MRLDIGGGTAPAAGHVNLDPAHGHGEFRRRVQEGIPLPNASVESARCSHLLEHVPAADRIAVLNEVWRVLVPGGTFEVIVPLFSPGSYGWLADPTHVSWWCEQSFWYFTGRMTPAADYGIRPWGMVEWTTRECEWGPEGRAVLRKPS